MTHQVSFLNSRGKFIGKPASSREAGGFLINLSEDPTGQIRTYDLRGPLMLVPHETIVRFDRAAYRTVSSIKPGAERVLAGTSVAVTLQGNDSLQLELSKNIQPKNRSQRMLKIENMFG